MSTSYTTNLGIQKPAAQDRNWDVPLNANADLLDATLLGAGAVKTTEVPSSTLHVAVAAMPYGFVKSNGTYGTFSGVASFLLTANSINYLYINDSGTLLASTSSWPGTPHARIAVVTTDASKVLAIHDARVTIRVF